MRDAVSDQMSNISNTVSRIWDKIKVCFSRILYNIVKTVKVRFSDIVDSVRDKMTEVRDKIEELMEKAIDYLRDVNLYDIGVDIIKGLINGIGSMASAV